MPRSISVREDILRMFDNDVEPSRIADAYNLPLPSVLTILIQEGRDVATPDVAVGQHVRDLILMEYHAWTPMRTIQQRTGLTRDAILQVLNEEGVPLRRVQVFKKLIRLRLEAELVDMYLQNVGVMDICDQMDIGYDFLRGVLSKYNVPLRQPRRGSTPRGKFVHPREVLEDLLASTNEE